jgi:hypothetical protein
MAKRFTPKIGGAENDEVRFTLTVDDDMDVNIKAESDSVEKTCIGYIKSSSGTLVLCPDDDLTELGLEVTEDGYIKVEYE